MLKFVHSAPATSIVSAIKSDVGKALSEVGMPPRLYLLAATKEPTAAWLSENGLSIPVVASPTISRKTGQVLYNFGGQTIIGKTGGKLQGNFFLPKDGFTVDAATHAAYVAARDEQAAKRTAKLTGQTDEDMEAGETTE